MTDADKLERIRSIVRDHDAYGLSRHHEMVLDITDVLAEKSEPPEDARQLAYAKGLLSRWHEDNMTFEHMRKVTEDFLYPEEKP